MDMIFFCFLDVCPKKIFLIYTTLLSRSMRSAWIEIMQSFAVDEEITVALHAERVDRNPLDRTCTADEYVALHAERVDRNSMTGSGF